MCASASAAAVRAAFEAAANHLLALARAVPAGGWERPALGEWNVRELLGHALRATLTVESYLEAGAQPPVKLERVTDYWLAAIETANHASVAERGREAGKALGDEPAGAVAAALERVLPKIGAAPGDALVGTPFGSMRLIDYLQTRILEMTVHALDLSAALGVRLDPPVTAQAISMAVTGEVLVARGLGPAVLLAVTGRGPLPAGFTLF